MNICMFVCVCVDTHIFIYAKLCTCVIIRVLSIVRYLYTDILIYLTYLQKKITMM